MSTIQINTVELYYEEHGTGNVPLVFVHGMLASSKMWQFFPLEALPPQYHAYAIDVRGHGQSHHITHGCTLPQLADDVSQFVHQLHLAPCVYVGLSMGAAIGLQLALDQPEVLRALILINPAFGSTLTGFARIFYPCVGLFAQNRWLLRPLLKSMTTKPLPQDMLEEILDETMLVSKAFWREYMHPSNIIGSLDRFRHLRIPTLVMLGENDTVIPQAMQHQLTECLPTVQKIVFENVGHGMLADIPDQILSAMVSFLDTLSV